MELDKEQFRGIVHGDSEEFDIVETSEWEDQGKWFSQEIIFKPKNKDKFFRIYASRSGFLLHRLGVWL